MSYLRTYILKMVNTKTKKKTHPKIVIQDSAREKMNFHSAFLYYFVGGTLGLHDDVRFFFRIYYFVLFYFTFYIHIFVKYAYVGIYLVRVFRESGHARLGH